jgi:hypothetical protein
MGTAVMMMLSIDDDAYFNHWLFINLDYSGFIFGFGFAKAYIFCMPNESPSHTFNYYLRA